MLKTSRFVQYDTNLTHIRPQSATHKQYQREGMMAGRRCLAVLVNHRDMEPVLMWLNRTAARPHNESDLFLCVVPALWVPTGGLGLWGPSHGALSAHTRDVKFGIQISPNLPKMGQIWEFFRTDLWSFWPHTEIWSEKVSDLFHLGPIWPTLVPK